MTARASPDEFFPYIQQAYFDLKNQPSIKNFFVPLNITTIAKKGEAHCSSDPKETSPISASTTESMPQSNNLISNDLAKEFESDFASEEVDKIVPEIKRHKVDDKPKKNPFTSSADQLIDIIGLIDGVEHVGATNSASGSNDSFLRCIDRYSKAKVINKQEQMDVDVDTLIEQLPTTQHTSPSTSKRKITDYFVKR